MTDPDDCAGASDILGVPNDRPGAERVDPVGEFLDFRRNRLGRIFAMLGDERVIGFREPVDLGLLLRRSAHARSG